MKTPEMEAHNEELNNSSGKPTEDEVKESRSNSETSESKAHEKQSKKPEESKKVSDKGEQTTSNESPVSKKDQIKSQIKKGGKIMTRMPGGKLGAIMGVTSIPAAVHTFKTDQEENGTAHALAKTSLFAAMPFIAPASILFTGAMAVGGYKALDKVGDAIEFSGRKEQMYQKAGGARPFESARFIETKDTYTMRQAGMAAIGQARGDLDDYMMGNEAQFLR